MNEFTREKLNFSELLKRYTIRIPSIQREYTYGNTDQATTEKRAELLEFIFYTIKGTQPKSLDFIYGNIEGSYLEPLDGQQRLTTLFLLYWLFTPNATKMLYDEQNKQSRFFYATRPTTQAFCNAFCQKAAQDLLTKWQKKESFSDFLLKQDWFLYQWRQDPSVKSMLNMLNDMVTRKGELPEHTKVTLENLTFYFLELKDIAGDEIYIKMNARGKQLSDFDLHKSALEEKIQKAFENKNEKEKFEEKWREAVDGDWLQFFWQNYGPTDNKDLPDYPEFDAVEDKYLLLWERLTDLYKLYEEIKQFEDKEPQKYLEQLYDDIKNLFYNDANNNNKMTDISEYLKDITFDCNQTDKSLLELMIGKKHQRQNKEERKKERTTSLDLPIQVMFVGMLLFARKFHENLHNQNEDTVKNFKQYMRVVRNISLNENKAVNWTNKDIPGFYNELKKLVEMFEKEYKNNNSLDFDTFLSTYKPNKQNANLDEEIWKAKLRKKDPKSSSEREQPWADLIKTAEDHDYFRGQILTLLTWSMPSPATDSERPEAKTKFKNYFKKFNDILDLGKKNQYPLYAALLSLKDYKQQIKQSTKYRLFNFYGQNGKYDMSRDYSWKRAALSKQDNQPPAIDVLKDFIDKCDKQNFDINEYIRQTPQIMPDMEDWRKCLTICPEVLEYSANKLIESLDGHWYLIPSRNFTQSSNEIYLTVLKTVLKKKLSIENISISHNSLSFPYKNKKYTIEVIGGGKYKFTIAKEGKSPKTYKRKMILFGNLGIGTFGGTVNKK